MRSFYDERGRHWDAVVGKESFGISVLLFTRWGSTEVWQLQMMCRTHAEAEDELKHMTDADLIAYLRQARPWE